MSAVCGNEFQVATMELQHSFKEFRILSQMRAFLASDKKGETLFLQKKRACLGGDP